MGAKAGIAVGAIIAGLALIGAIGFLFWRRGKNAGLKGKGEYELRATNLGTANGEPRA
jgi:LPXTG-motif cell wall-anchored protein